MDYKGVFLKKKEKIYFTSERCIKNLESDKKFYHVISKVMELINILSKHFIAMISLVPLFLLKEE